MTNVRLAGLTVACIATACAPAGDAAPASAPETTWPGESWAESTPAAEGVDPAAMDALVADIDAGRYGLIDHLLIIRNGKAIVDRNWDNYDEYVALLAEQDDTTSHAYNYDHPDWHPFYRDTHLHSLQSVTKSVTSIAFGIAVDEGHIAGVEEPAWRHLEAYSPDMSDPRRAATTLEDFLTMRSGIAWARPGETYQDEAHPTIVLEGSDEWIRYVVERPLAEDPGVRFDYNDGVSVLLGKIVREATGRRLDEWTEEKLFEPIGIDEYNWKITPDGEVDSEGGLYLSTHDLARVGYLMLRNGEWDGRQVVSREWVRASTAPVIPDVNPANGRPDSGYGYQWWVPRHEDGEARVFAGNGYGGQFVHVVPEYDLVVVFNGWTLHESPEMSSWMAVQDRVIPAILDGPEDGPEDDVSAVLDALHEAASEADFEGYFGLYADEFVFLGTDATERWDREQFMEYARAPFSEGRGWTYMPIERHVTIAPGGRAAWFDERLENANLGETRGSGALILEDGEWKITQYNLTIPIPNELARDIVERIRERSAG